MEEEIEKSNSNTTLVHGGEYGDFIFHSKSGTILTQSETMGLLDRTFTEGNRNTIKSLRKICN